MKKIVHLMCERCANGYAYRKLISGRWVCGRCYCELPFNVDDRVRDDMQTGIIKKRGKVKVNWSIVKE